MADKFRIKWTCVALGAYVSNRWRVERRSRDWYVSFDGEALHVSPSERSAKDWARREGETWRAKRAADRLKAGG